MAPVRLAIVAGGGDLPRRVAAQARKTGRNPFVVGLKGFAEASLLEEYGGPELSVGELGRLIQLMKREGCEEMVFAGWLKRPDFSALKLERFATFVVSSLVMIAIVVLPDPPLGFTTTIRSMSVAPPPTPDGRLRIIEVGDLDRQACGGTHLSNTGESRPVRLVKIENKGRHNRRIRIALT